MADRYTQIDIAKGIGILLIVAGHNYKVVSEHGKLFNILYSFHVPLFFFIAGMFMHFKNDLRGYTIKKLDSYLKPYFITFFLLGFIVIPLEGINPVNYLARIVYGTGPIFPSGWVQLWFLPQLFVVSVFSYLCCNNADLVVKSHLFKATFLIVIISIGFLGIDSFWYIPVPGTHIILPGLPFGIDLILISSFYFLLGSFLKHDILSLKINWYMFALVAVVFAFLHFQFDYTVNLNMRRYDNIFISTITALAGIYLVMSVSIILKDTPIIAKILSYIGTASLLILIFHNYVQLQTILILTPLIRKHFIIIAFISFTMAVLVPIIIYELIRRNAVLKLVFLPIRHIRVKGTI